MKVVHKYTLTPNESTVLSLPEGANPVFAAFQGPMLRLWVEVDTDARQAPPRRFLAAGTGQELREGDHRPAGYVASAQYDDGRYVYHVYELF